MVVRNVSICAGHDNWRSSVIRRVPGEIPALRVQVQHRPAMGKHGRRRRWWCDLVNWYQDSPLTRAKYRKFVAAMNPFAREGIR